MDVQRVRVTDGKLAFAWLLGDEGVTLLTAGADRFRRLAETEPGVVFLRDARGEVTGVQAWEADNIRAGNYERTTVFRAYAPLLVLLLCLVLVLSTLVVTVHTLLRRPKIGRVVRGYAFLVALACTTLVVYLASWGFIGLQTWAY
jgi:hypothetical protein